jgi:transcriptional regulator GlxA family with amidase domain
VSLVAIPEAVISTLSCIFDVMNALAIMPPPERAPGERAPFRVEIVGEKVGPCELASRVPVMVQKSIDQIARTDIVIVPSILLPAAGGWVKDRHPKLVAWLAEMHRQGALLCSACSGIFLIAETGIFDGRDATVHFAYAGDFAAAYPDVPIHPEQTLVVSGKREELISSGASMTWHDLVLYLIGRHAAQRRRRRWRGCSRCNGTRTGSPLSWCSRAARTTAMSRSRPRRTGSAPTSRSPTRSSRW